jgi:hypothetical protein
LTRVLEGRSCFRLNSLPAGPSSQPLNFALEWDRTVDQQGLAQIPNVAPGLYSLKKGDPTADGSCQVDPDNATAWVLVAPSADFARLDTEWKQQVASINELERSGASLSALTTIRHAALAHLARSFLPR